MGWDVERSFAEVFVSEPQERCYSAVVCLVPEFGWPDGPGGTRCDLEVADDTIYVVVGPCCYGDRENMWPFARVPLASFWFELAATTRPEIPARVVCALQGDELRTAREALDRFWTRWNQSSS